MPDIRAYIFGGLSANVRKRIASVSQRDMCKAHYSRSDLVLLGPDSMKREYSMVSHAFNEQQVC